MRAPLLPVAAMMLASSSCGVLHNTWIEVRAGLAATTYTREWPPGSGEYVTVRDLLSDPAGLAGIEVEIRVPGETPVKLANSNFGADGTSGPVEVPDGGTASVFVTLHQFGELVAEGHVSWALEKRIEQWRVLIERSPQAADTLYDEDDEVFECVLPGCRQVIRIEIDEAARNYPDEVLWLTLWGYYLE